jgi:hypothetical protein
VKLVVDAVAGHYYVNALFNDARIHVVAGCLHRPRGVGVGLKNVKLILLCLLVHSTKYVWES